MFDPAIVNVHIVDSPWPGLVVSASVGLGGAVIGAGAVLIAGRHQRVSEENRAARDRADERELVAAQYQRELLAKASDQLFDALWTRERELCEGLHLARVEARSESPPQPIDAPSFEVLGKVEFAIYRDMITALPFVLDVTLRERLRSAAGVANGCMNLRGTNGGALAEAYERAMIEVQHYFKWLRWNLVCALQGDPIPDSTDPPDVRRPMGQEWRLPASGPGWT